MSRSLFIWFFLTLLCSSTVLAQNPTPHSGESVELQKIVISASRLKQRLLQVAQSVDVVNREEIKKSGALTVADVLQEIPGVNLVSLGSPGDDLNIRMRGSDRDEIMVMIDGVSINNFTESRAVLLNSIPVDLIKKIEIIRGAQSVIYGSSAVGGIINIITIKGWKKPVYSLGFQGGNLGTFKETAMASGQYGKHAFGVSYSRHDQHGRFDNDEFHANNVFANYGVQFSDISKLQTSVLFLNQKQELAFGTATSFANMPILYNYIIHDKDRYIRRNILLSQASFEIKPLRWYNIKFSYGMFYEDLYLQNSNQTDTAPDPTAQIDSQDYDSLGHRHSFDLRNSFHLIDQEGFKIDAVAGVIGDIEFLKYTDNPFPGDTTTKTTSTYPDKSAGQKDFRRNISGYLETSFNVKDRFYLGAGVRYDDNDTYGHAVSPRISLSYFIPKTKSKFFFTFSKGFLAPTLNQYYLAVVGTTLTQRLDKETSWTTEVGFHQKDVKLGIFGKLGFGSTFFHTKYDTYIDGLQLINAAHVTGFESFIAYKPIKWLSINANYTYMQAVNDGDGSDLAQRPRHQFYGDIRVSPLSNLTFIFNAHYVSNKVIPSVLSTNAFGDLTYFTFDTNGTQSGTRLPAYYTLNASAHYKQKIKTNWLHEIVFSVRANNLLNKSYQESFGYPMPKFNFLAGIDFKY